VTGFSICLSIANTRHVVNTDYGPETVFYNSPCESTRQSLTTTVTITVTIRLENGTNSLDAYMIDCRPLFYMSSSVIGYYFRGKRRPRIYVRVVKHAGFPTSRPITLETPSCYIRVRLSVAPFGRENGLVVPVNHLLYFVSSACPIFLHSIRFSRRSCSGSNNNNNNNNLYFETHRILTEN